MSGLKRIFVLGGHTSKFIGKGSKHFIDKKHPLFGKKENPTLKEYMHETIRETIKMNGMKLEDKSLPIDNAFVGNFASELYCNQGHLGAMVAGAHPALNYIPSCRVEGACSSGGLAFAMACNSIKAGADISLVLGAEVQNTATARQGGDYLARAADYERQRKIDEFTFPALFAIRKKAAFKAYGPKFEENLYKNIVVPAYKGANKNPKAQMHTAKMSVELAMKSPVFLNNPELKPHMRTAECSQVTDGGASCLIVSEQGLKKLGKKPSDAIEVVGYSYIAGNLFEDTDPLVMLTSKINGEKVYKMTKIAPKDIDYAEIHDCFAMAQCLQNEGFGWAKKGEGNMPLATKVQVNLGGGLQAFGHPTGATGVKQINEIFGQMKGKCGDYQMKKKPALGLMSNMGGNDKTSVVSIFKNL